jgi:hypothetical protein
MIDLAKISVTRSRNIEELNESEDEEEMLKK